jgi:hypothetical protein
MKKSTKVLLLSALLSCLVAVGTTATTKVSGEIIYMTTDDDTVSVGSSGFAYGTRIGGIKVIGTKASGTYTIKNTNTSGAIMYQLKTGATTGTVTMEYPKFTIPSGGLHLDTDDTDTTNVKVFLYRAK